MSQVNPESLTPTPSPFVPHKLSYEEFLREYDGQFAEYVSSEVIEPVSVTKKHSQLTHFLSAILQFYVETKNLGQIFGGPYQMKMAFEDGIHGREPDIFFVKTENFHRLDEQFLEGAADLVIEVISPESIASDTVEKFEEYESAGVKEYWIIDYNRRTANFYGHDENKKYKLLLPATDEKFESREIEGLWIKTDWLWQEPLPSLRDVLKEWGLV